MIATFWSFVAYFMAGLVLFSFWSFVANYRTYKDRMRLIAAWRDSFEPFPDALYHEFGNVTYGRHYIRRLFFLNPFRLYGPATQKFLTKK